MINLKNINSASCTGKENLVFLTSYNKAIIYDLNTKSDIAEFRISNIADYNNIAFENYMTINADAPCILDLNCMKIIHKFSLYDIFNLIKNKLLREKYNVKIKNKSSLSDNFSVDNFYGMIVDINRERLTLLVSYAVFGHGTCDKYVDLAEFEMGTWRFIGYKNDVTDSFEYQYKRAEIKYPFLCYDFDRLNNIFRQLNLKTYSGTDRDFWQFVLYYPKYRVLFYFGRMYELDNDKNLEEDKLPSDDEFNQKGFDSEKYLRENGVTDKALKYLSHEIVMEGGYLRALDSLEKKAKELNIGIKFGGILNAPFLTEEEYIFYNIGLFDLMVTDDGFGEFFEEGDEEEFNELIKVLNLIGAKQTVKIVKKCIAISKKYKDDKSTMQVKFDDIVALADDIEDDYTGLAINYIKKQRGIVS